MLHIILQGCVYYGGGVGACYKWCVGVTEGEGGGGSGITRVCV